MEELQKKTEWDKGFDAGQDFVLAMIKDLAGVEFKTVTELITFVRQKSDGTFVKEK
jgi:hypothetical protein